MVVFLIIGLVLLGISYPLMKALEKQNSRWSNLVFAICLFLGIICLGIFAA